jgi:amidase
VLHHLSRSHCHRFFDPTLAPVLTIDPGDCVLVETWDCFSNLVTSAAQRFGSLDELLALTGGFNPVAGPIFVRGAQAGDALAVHIEAITLGVVDPVAVTVVVPGMGGLCSPVALGAAVGPDTRICPIDGDTVVFPTRSGELRLPIRPMIGTIGTAPAREVVSSLKFGAEFCGNVDCPDVTVGHSVVLPVNVTGGLLSLGDVHAAMGDAEITGVALETSADVLIRVDLLPGAESPYVRCPQVETPTALGSLGCHFGLPLDYNVRAAFHDLVQRLQQGYHLTEIEAYELLGAAARVRVNQCVDGGWTSVLVSIERALLQRS